MLPELETVMFPEMVSLLLAKVTVPPLAVRPPLSLKTVPLAKVKVPLPRSGYFRVQHRGRIQRIAAIEFECGTN